MLTVTFILLIAAAAAAASPPGLKVTLSQNCISYGKDWAITKLLPSLQNLHAPDVHGKAGMRPFAMMRARLAQHDPRIAHRRH
jgi:hypothetical protein